MNTNSPPIILLWDIDGTLIRSGGAGMRALTRAVTRCTGAEEDLSSVYLAGSMDGDVFAQICLPRKIDVEKLAEAYLAELPICMANARGLVPPGVRAVLDRTHSSPKFCNALLTGNLVQGAQIKLRHFGLWDYFRFGAFGNEARKRPELGLIAMAKAARHMGRPLPSENFWIIGDTPRDVAVAKACGFHCLAVGTGGGSPEEIQAAGPDVFFGDLSDTERVMQVFGG